MISVQILIIRQSFAQLIFQLIEMEQNGEVEEEWQIEDVEINNECIKDKQVSIEDGDAPNLDATEQDDEELSDNSVMFSFNRTREPKNVPLNVVNLAYPFKPDEYLDGDDAEEYVECMQKAEIYIVGTAHFSSASQKDVEQTIEAVQPDFVMVELCDSRKMVIFMNDEEFRETSEDVTFRKYRQMIKSCGFLYGTIHATMLLLSSTLTKKLDLSPGGEFRCAYQACQKVPNCYFIYGDRPIFISLTRTINSMSLYERIKFLFHLVVSLKGDISQEEVESFKNMDMLEKILKEMGNKLPQLKKYLVEERDEYMTQVLRKYMEVITLRKRQIWLEEGKKHEWQNVVGVLVVGLGHVPGIKANWENKDIDCRELLKINESKLTVTSKVVAFSLLGILISVTSYSVYRIGMKVTHLITSFLR